MNFASLRHQISHFVHESREPLTAAKLREVCDMAVDDRQLSNAIFQMCKYGELTRRPAPTSAGMGVRHAYGPGKNKPGALALEEDAGGGRPKSREIGRAGEREIEAAREEAPQAQVRKVQRKTKPPRATPTRATRWALTSDGAFVLLGTALTLPTAFMREYVAFVRDSTPAQRDALVAFIEKLDKAKA